ncbi:Gfo/Idh/MocA family oxidoreductase, partial [Streptomyces sp. SR27]
MRIGLIGTGRIGSFHAGVLARHPEVESLVVADADAGRAAGVAGALGAEAAPDVTALFGHALDAVV